MKRLVTILAIFVFVIVPNVISQTVAEISLYKPLNGEMGVSTTPTIRWQTNVGDVYQVQLSRATDFSSIAMSMTVPATTSATEIMVGGLEYNTTYFWRVRNSQQPTWSTVFTFSTSGAPLTSALLTTPPNGVTMAYTSALPLEWNVVDYATGYDIQISTTQLFVSTEVDAHVDVNQLTATTLKDNNTYYWRVRATNGDTKGEWSSVARFNIGNEMLAVPASPVLATPGNGTVNAKTTQTLAWQPVVNAVKYEVEVSPTPQFFTVTYKAVTEETTTSVVNNLNPNMKYFWRVKSSNTNGESVWSSAYTFITGKAPYAPQLALPAHESAVAPTSAVMSWDNVPEATGYHIQVSTTSTFSDIIFEEKHVTGNSISTTFPEDKLLFWRVRSENEFGSGTWSPWRFFKTNNTINVVTKESDLHLSNITVSPNPGGNVVSISYIVPAKGKVQLTILDEMGSPVATLLNETQDVGSYQIPLVLKSIEQGVYMYHISYNGIVETGKFVIVK